MFSQEEKKLLGTLTFGYFLLFQIALRTGDIKSELEDITKDGKMKELHGGLMEFHKLFMKKKAQVQQLQSVLKKEVKEQEFFEEQIQAGRDQLKTYSELCEEWVRKRSFMREN